MQRHRASEKTRAWNCWVGGGAIPGFLCVELVLLIPFFGDSVANGQEEGVPAGKDDCCERVFSLQCFVSSYEK